MCLERYKLNHVAFGNLDLVRRERVGMAAGCGTAATPDRFAPSQLISLCAHPLFILFRFAFNVSLAHDTAVRVCLGSNLAPRGQNLSRGPYKLPD